jgi:ATP-dependent helicase HrpA
VVDYRWMLEELRVSLFAQSLGTAAPVSAKRLEEAWRRAAAA